MLLSDDQKTTLIQSAHRLFQSSKGYNQRKITDKLQVLGYPTTTSTFNKILKGKRVGTETLTTVCEAMQVLAAQELCLQPAADLTWQSVADCVPAVVELPTEGSDEGFILHAQGRLTLQEKTAFLAEAQSRVIEFGTTLNTFSEYFMSRKAADFKLPVQRLLERGVDFECYLLDPHWSGTLMYFDDRSAAVEGGKEGLEKIKNTLRKLKIVAAEYAVLDLPGSFKIFTYRHFPFNYFLAIDPDDKARARLMVSNYLYGLPRADCPVLQFSRAAHPVLFLRYQKALRALIASAKPVDLRAIE